MKKKNLNIYFIGRRQGHNYYKYLPSKIENLRKYEEIGFNNTDYLYRTYFKNSSNIIFFRNKPEKTTDSIVKSLNKELLNIKNKLIINDIRSFYNYDSKDLTFEIWTRSNLFCPNFLSFSKKDLNKKNDALIKIANFLKIYKKIILRTNNETGSRGLYVLDNENQIELILKKLKKRMNHLLNDRNDTKIMCVEYVETKDCKGYRDLYRVHVLFDKIICYYVSSSKQNILYNSLMSKQDIDRFIQKNHDFGILLPKIKNEIIKSVKVLGNNIGAVELLLVDNKPFFIELNPMWGGHAGRHGFGDSEMMKYLLTNQDDLIKKIPNVYKWLDYKTFYKSIYSDIRDYYNEKY